MNNANDLDFFKLYVQDLGNLGVRHDSSRAFYLSVISAFLTLLSLADKDKTLFAMRGDVRVVIGIVGIGLCLIWALHMRAYAALFSAKFKVLSDLTKRMDAFDLFGTEWASLRNDSRYTSSRNVDIYVPWLFIFPFALLLWLQQGRGAI